MEILTSQDLFESLVLGFIAPSLLLIGCLLSIFAKVSKNVITTIMAFGSGVFIATSTFSILVEAFSVTHTQPATAIGFSFIFLTLGFSIKRS